HLDYPIRLDTAYGYDPFGNVTATMACASDFDSCVIGNSNASQASEFPDTHPPFRVTTVSYDPGLLGTAVSYGIGRFPVQTTNSLGQTEKTEYDPVQGQVIRKTGPNGIQTCVAYAVFGRPTSETDRCGSV